MYCFLKHDIYSDTGGDSSIRFGNFHSSHRLRFVLSTPKLFQQTFFVFLEVVQQVGRIPSTPALPPLLLTRLNARFKFSRLRKRSNRSSTPPSSLCSRVAVLHTSRVPSGSTLSFPRQPAAGQFSVFITLLTFLQFRVLLLFGPSRKKKTSRYYGLG